MALTVTLDHFKDVLEIGATTAHDEALQFWLDLAESAMLEHVRQRLGTADERAAWSDEIDGWNPDTAPIEVRGAILWLAAHFYKHRGDAHPEDTPAAHLNELPREATRLVVRYRDAAMAAPTPDEDEE